MSNDKRLRLTPLQFRVLKAFATLDPKGEYQYNVWNPDLERTVKTLCDEDGISTSWWESELVSLTKRGALVAEGRGNFRQWGITPLGLESIA